ncbi:hypothetical protein [Streptomyces sp. NPDC054797]
MTGRQRRTGVSVLAGTGLAATGWWAQWSGHEVVGLVLTLLAGMVVLGAAWRSGALHLPQTTEPAPGPPSSARAKADQEAVDAAAEGDRRSRRRRAAGGAVGVRADRPLRRRRTPGQDYAPAGHGYPRP